jgi:hypothetical protein
MNLALLTAILIKENEAYLSASSLSSSCSSSNEDDVMLVSTTDKLLQHTSSIVSEIDGGTKDHTINWQQDGGLLI